MIAKFFIDRPVFAWVIALIILLSGSVAITKLPIAQYPEIAPPSLAVSTVYPGASAEVVSETVTSVIEKEMNGIEGLLFMDSGSDSSGVMNLTLTFESGTDIDIALVETQSRLKRVEARMPEEVRRQGVNIVKSRNNYLMFISVFSPDKSFDRVALGNYTAANILDNLRRVRGVGEVDLFGPEYAMRIWLDPNKLVGYRLTPADVYTALAEQNIQVAAGGVGLLPSAPGQQMEATMVTQGRLSTVEEFNSVIIRANSDGSTVKVSDVAKVELNANSFDVVAWYNRQPTAAMGVKLSPTGNALETANLVKAKMEELGKYLPPGMEWTVPYDTSLFVKISIEEVLQTLIEAIVLVFLVIYLFLQNFRATFIPTIVVPVALVGTFAGLLAFGFSINVLTMFGLVLAIGIVVDDAIVVVENVERIMSTEGLSSRDATRKAMDQIIGAIIGITLVLVAVFLPMMFFGGSVGAIYRQFAVTLVLSMLFSALMALTLTPALCAVMLKPITKGEHHERGGFFGWFNRSFDRMTSGYQGIVKRVVRKVGRYLFLYAAILAATGWLFTKLPGSFLPEEDQGYFVGIVQLPPGASQERTVEVLNNAQDYLMNHPGIEKVFGIAGFSFFGSGQNAGLVFVLLKDWKKRTTPALQIDQIVQDTNMQFFQYKSAFAFATNVPPIPELGNVGGFDFRLEDRAGLGNDVLNQAMGQLLGMASQNPAIVGVRPNAKQAAPQVRLTIDRAKALAMGVSISEINATLQIAFGSAYVNDFVYEGRVQRVLMQLQASDRMKPEDISKLYVRNKNGEMVPLSSFVTSSWELGPTKLDRFNGFPAIAISGNAAPGRSSGEAMAAMEEMVKQLPAGIGYEWAGQSYEERLSGAQAPILFGLSMLVVFFCLAALYESWSIPFSVLLVVPLGIFGSLLASLIRDLPNDVYFKVGLIAIIGLSSKNAILIIEFAKELQEKGMGLIEATIEATRLRFRPILMTSIAFMLGVLPLVISSGAGSASRHAIGTGVFGGMLTATVLAVILVPAFFVVVRKIFPDKKRRHAIEPSEESHEA